MEATFENELTGKLALVTGGSKGMGKAITDRLLTAGATVIVTARNKPEDQTNGIHFIAADLRDQFQKL
ncbi:SDR family NAD(P)-dependent oxidoreductase [Spirosoma pollinicola]|uniref:SDR family NAD(P)-dependent oxidoreductase n=1 Tax=Spirosoma pollinicola TaxID=2057025 RepID=UPI0026A49D41